MRLTVTFISILVLSFMTVRLTLGQSSDSLIGARDVLRLSVFEEPDLSFDVVVSGNGEFSYPLLGVVKAVGLTVNELARHMEKRLKDEQFLVEPSVRVRFIEQNNTVVSIVGAIVQPGIEPIYPGLRLRDVLAKHGGIKEEEAAPYISVQRANGAFLQINRDDLLTAGDVESTTGNVVLITGDEIIVPFAKQIYVLGAVNRPGGIPLTRNLRVGDAFGLAGGRKENAGQSMFWHRNVETEKQEIITFTYDEYQNNVKFRSQLLHPGDSIYVPQNDMVFVSGQVNNPGAIAWKPGMTVMNAIVEAGDRTFTASRTVRVYRIGPDGKHNMTKYSLSDLQKGNVEFLVKPGDIIHVSHSLLNIPYTVRRLNPFSLPLNFLESSAF